MEFQLHELTVAPPQTVRRSMDLARERQTSVTEDPRVIKLR